MPVGAVPQEWVMFWNTFNVLVRCVLVVLATATALLACGSVTRSDDSSPTIVRGAPLLERPTARRLDELIAELHNAQRLADECRILIDKPLTCFP